MTGQAQIIDKAKKLRELAERGVDGEKETAIRMYAAYKEKHSLTDDQVVGHRYTESFKVNYSNVSDQEFMNNLNEFINSDSFKQLVNVLAKMFR